MRDERCCQSHQPLSTGVLRRKASWSICFTRKAAALLKADCPTYRMLTPVGRTAAVEQRLAGTRTAVKTVEPALTKFTICSATSRRRFDALRAVDRSQG
jgi:hypothetical protein